MGEQTGLLTDWGVDVAMGYDRCVHDKWVQEAKVPRRLVAEFIVVSQERRLGVKHVRRLEGSNDIHSMNMA